MANPRRLTALAMARAMLAGEPSEHGLASRLRACLDEPARQWHESVAQRCARIPREQWRRLTVRALATLIERDTGYQAAWLSDAPPYARRYILRPRERMNALPLGLHECRLPRWPNHDALAHGLGLSREGLWRLSLESAWQRRRPLAEQHYRARLIAKRSGGWRLLEVPQPYLREVQRGLLRELLNQVPPHDAACGYTRGRSLLDHVQRHVGQAVVLRFDLQDFFASVRASRVHALFTTLGYPGEVARTLAALCTTATPEPVLARLREGGGWSWQQAQRFRDAHLPQGAPTSPALANLCAFRLDLRLQGLAETLGARYSRYADDLVISGGHVLREIFDRIRTWVGRIAVEEGFSLQHRKTRCTPAARRQSVCGVVVNQRPNMPRDDFDRLKATLHRCARNGPAAENRACLPAWRQHLEGRVAWAAQLNPARGERLRGLLARIDWTR